MMGKVGSSVAAGLTMMGEVARLLLRDGLREGFSELLRDGRRDEAAAWRVTRGTRRLTMSLQYIGPWFGHNHVDVSFWKSTVKDYLKHVFRPVSKCV